MVSDGSYKEGWGSAAWVLEGVDSLHCMLGKTIVPGIEKIRLPIIVSSLVCTVLLY
jgi:hypothetical protein